MDYKRKRIIITGSSGFIGSYLTTELIRRNANVVKLDIESGTDILNWENIKHIENFDLVYHLAAWTYVPDSYENPYKFYYNNVLSTLNILELSRLNQAKMIFLSSYVYGQPKYLPIDENHPIEGLNPYAQSKIICEKMCEGYHRDHGVPVIVLRPSNIYGQGQGSNFLIPTIMDQVKKGNLQLMDSRPRRDYIYIDDFIEACIKVGSYSDSEFERFNIGSGKSYSVEEIVNMVRLILKKDFNVQYLGANRKVDVLDTCYDIVKARHLLEWKPQIDIVEGLKRVIK